MQILLQFYLDLFFLKKTTLQLFLSRSEDVRVIGYDMDFFFGNIILTFSQMMDWLCNS